MKLVKRKTENILIFQQNKLWYVAVWTDDNKLFQAVKETTGKHGWQEPCNELTQRWGRCSQRNSGIYRRGRMAPTTLSLLNSFSGVHGAVGRCAHVSRPRRQREETGRFSRCYETPVSCNSPTRASINVSKSCCDTYTRNLMECGETQSDYSSDRSPSLLSIQ